MQRPVAQWRKFTGPGSVSLSLPPCFLPDNSVLGCGVYWLVWWWGSQGGSVHWQPATAGHTTNNETFTNECSIPACITRMTLGVLFTHFKLSYIKYCSHLNQSPDEFHMFGDFQSLPQLSFWRNCVKIWAGLTVSGIRVQMNISDGLGSLAGPSSL